MMLEGESLVQEFKYWEIRILQIYVQATPLEVDSRRIQFLIEEQSLVKSGRRSISRLYRHISGHVTIFSLAAYKLHSHTLKLVLFTFS